jgi:tripartite-type tricarboxylate transporter receptor subunit TctC
MTPTTPTTRLLVATLAFLVVVAGLAPPAAADWPEREIRLIVPFPPGGSTDIVGRIVAQPLGKRLGQPIVVENRGGAGGTVGTQAAASSRNDGHTLVVATTSTHVVGPSVHSTVKYDPVNDFAPIGLVGETPYVLVVAPKLPVASVKELVALAKEKPGALNFGSAGVGSTTHLAGEMFLAASGVKMTHIPYAGNREATTAVMGGEVQVLFGSMPAVLAQIRANSIKALAVGTTRRSPQLPDVPTVQEAGVPGYRASLWLGLAAPAGTPEPVVKRLHQELTAVVKDPAVAEQLVKNGAEPATTTPEEFRQLIREELGIYRRIIDALGLRK